MKFSNKRRQFEASNVSFSTVKLEAYSYNWWKFVSVVNGVLVFNATNYSPTTNRHQSKVLKLMLSKGIKPKLVLKFTRQSLGESALKDEVVLAKLEIRSLELILLNNRRKKALDTKRQSMVELLKEHIRRVEIVLNITELNVQLT